MTLLRLASYLALDIALALPTIAFGSWLWHGKRISRLRWTGLVLILSGDLVAWYGVPTLWTWVGIGLLLIGLWLASKPPGG